MDALIHDRGRGPEIVGTRITVYDIMDYEGKYSTDFIAGLFKVDIAQVDAALAYIAEHRDELMVEYRKMLARDAAGNSPEIRAKLAVSRRYLRKLRQIRERSLERYQAIMAGRRADPSSFRTLVDHHFEALKAGAARAGHPG